MWLSVSAGSDSALVEDDPHRNLLLSQVKEDGDITAQTTVGWLQAWHSSVPRQKAIQVDSGGKPADTPTTGGI
jgi:hypothetical protein